MTTGKGSDVKVVQQHDRDLQTHSQEARTDPNKDFSSHVFVWCGPGDSGLWNDDGSSSFLALCCKQKASAPLGKTSCCSGEPQNPLLSRREIDSQQSFKVCEEEVYQEPRQTDSCWGPPAYGDLRQATHSPLCWSSAALDVAYTS
ncbi:unnamed protein product [Arctogadus glacialis]